VFEIEDLESVIPKRCSSSGPRFDEIGRRGSREWEVGVQIFYSLTQFILICYGSMRLNAYYLSVCENGKVKRFR
jgi:hypothetical protein